MDCKYSKILDNQPNQQLKINNNNNNNNCKLLMPQQQQQITQTGGCLEQQQVSFNNTTRSLLSQNTFAGYHGCNAPPTLPIDDFYLIENANKYSEEEKQLRIKLAAVYRLIEINGWSMGIYNHVTAKLEKQTERVLIHPFGLHYNEITASSLLKIDMSGNIVDQGSTNFELNRPGYIVHSAIHMARPDLKAVIHLHYPPVAAVSACKYGLLPVCQEQALLGEISYLDYNGILTQEDERDAVAAGLGQKCKVMLLRNHGLIVCGETIEEAFYLLNNLMRACETQARLLTTGVGLDDLILMSEDASHQAWSMVQSSRYPIKQSLLPLPAATATTTTTSQSCNITDEERLSDESTTSGNESDMDQSDSGSNISNNIISSTASNQPQRQKTSLLQLQARKNLKQKNIIGYVNMFELDFEAQMRALDTLGHETGYKYKRPLVRQYNRRV